jgi:hypothetical protein
MERTTSTGGSPDAPDAAEIRQSIRELKGRAKVGAK